MSRQTVQFMSDAINSISVGPWVQGSVRDHRCRGPVSKATPGTSLSVELPHFLRFWYNQNQKFVNQGFPYLPALAQQFGRARYITQENCFISIAVLGTAEMRSQVGDSWFEVCTGPSIKARIPAEMGFATTTTPELRWSSCPSFHLPGSLLEVSSRPENTWKLPLKLEICHYYGMLHFEHVSLPAWTGDGVETS